MSRWLESLQRNGIGDLSLFSSGVGTRRSRTEQVRGFGRAWEGRNVVFRQKFICGDSPVSRGIVMVQNPVAGTPLLRAMSAHSVAEALQDSYVEFLFTVCPLGTYSWWTSPSMSKNAVNMVLTLDFTCRAFFGRGDDAVFHWDGICFVSRSYP